MNRDAFETKTTKVNGREVTFTLYHDHEANVADFECYSARDIEAWKRDEWSYVIVVAEMGYGDAVISGVEYGSLAEISIGMDQIIADHGDDLVSEIMSRKVHMTGGEPFGTKVTFWSTHWGIRHALVISSPKPEAEREFLDTKEWGIVIRPDRSGGGMTFAPGEQLTLGWHPDGDAS